MLDDGPVLHDGNVPAQLGRQLNIVRDGQQGIVGIGTNMLHQQFTDAVSQGDIQALGGLVGDQQCCAGCAGGGKSDALRHTA